MRKVYGMFLVFAVCIFSTTAQARNVWRECGIGGMLFTNTGWAAITSNIIWDLGTSATSSDISSDGLCEGPKVSAANFVHGTYATIEEQTVMGQGDHLVAMLDILGCERSAHDKIIQSVRTDFSKDIARPGYESLEAIEKTKNYHTNLMNKIEGNFTSQCHLI